MGEIGDRGAKGAPGWGRVTETVLKQHPLQIKKNSAMIADYGVALFR
jgi:hypothetical protein